MSVKLWFLSVCFCILFDNQVHGNYIRFFRDFNHTDLYYGSSIPYGCNQLPDFGTPIFSVETDTCVILYQGQLGQDCKAPDEHSPDSRSQTINSNFSSTIFRHITGYRMCNADGGKLQLNIEIIKPDDSVYPPTKLTTVVKIHRDVCSCVNISDDIEYLSNWAILNHGNEYVAFFHSDCTERQHKAIVISGEQTWIFNKPFIKVDNALNTRLRIESISPYNNSVYLKQGCNMKDNIVDLQNNTFELEQNFIMSALASIESQTSIIAIQHKQNEEILKIEQKIKESEIAFNESQTDVLAEGQRQNIDIRMLEEKYNDTGFKLEKLQNELDNKVGNFRDE